MIQLCHNLQPGISFFLEKFGDDSQCPLAAFKAARLFSPSKIHEIQPTAQDVDVLSVFPFLNDPVKPLSHGQRKSGSNPN